MAPMPARPKEPAPSRFDIYGGYGYFHPFHSEINNYAYEPVDNMNVTVSMTGYFNTHVGLQIEGEYFSGNQARNIPGQCAYYACADRDQLVYTAEAGPIIRMQRGRWAPYAHLLGGGSKVNGPYLQRLTWGQGVTAGVGVDYILPFFHDLFAVRPIQADMQYSHVHYGQVIDANHSGVGDLINYKLSGGLVLRLGQIAPPMQLQVACSVEPIAVYPGDSVMLHATPINLEPKKIVQYTWSATGGSVSAATVTSVVNTTGLAPGTYTAMAHVSEGPKPFEQASCSTTYTVKAFEPPTLSCFAVPYSITPGQNASVVANGVSPQHRPLTYSYSVTGGQISGSGPSVTLNTAPSTATGPIQITCNVVDDQGKTATANTSVTVAPPPPPPVCGQCSTNSSSPEYLCTASFTRDAKRPERVDNEAKACLDDVALAMQHSTGAKLVVIGDHTANESRETAEQRALNVQQYLTQEKGIDPSMIEVRVGNNPGKKVENLLLRQGAEMPNNGATSFDTGSVHRHGQAYGTGQKKRKK
jgi:hypothetical protein